MVSIIKHEGIEIKLKSKVRESFPLKSANTCSGLDNAYNIKNDRYKSKQNHIVLDVKDFSENSSKKKNNQKRESKDSITAISFYPITQNYIIEEGKENFNKYQKKNYFDNEYNYYNELLKQKQLNKDYHLKESSNNGNNVNKTNYSSFLVPTNQTKNDSTPLKSNNYTSKPKIVKAINANVGFLYINNSKINAYNQKVGNENEIIKRKSKIKEEISNHKFIYNNKENNNLIGTSKNYAMIDIKEDEEKEFKKKKCDGQSENIYYETFGKKRRRGLESREIKKNNENEEKARFDKRDAEIKNTEKKFKEKEEKYRYGKIEESQINTTYNNLNEKIKKLKNENKIIIERYAKLDDNFHLLASENERYKELIEEYKENLKKNELKMKVKINEIIAFTKIKKEREALLIEKENKINEYGKKIKYYNYKIYSLEEKEKQNQSLLKESSNKINELENKVFELEENEKKNMTLLNEKKSKINELESLIEKIKKINNKISTSENNLKKNLNKKDNKIKELDDLIIELEENEKKSKILLEEKDNKLRELDDLIIDNKNKIFEFQENENNLKKNLKIKDNKIKELDDLITNYKNKVLELEEYEKKSKILLEEKDNKINKLEIIIKNYNYEISKLKKQINEISENYNNEINKYKEKTNQLEKKITKEYENITANQGNKQQEKKVLNNQFDIKANIDFINEPKTKSNYEENRLFKNDIYIKSDIEQKKEQTGICDKNKEFSNEEYKIYGFINQSSDCYLNSSLQLLTRINDLKNGIYNYEKKYKINENNDTEGQLFIEFKKILDKIKNSKKEYLTINPQSLKNIMGKIDEKYYDNNQEDADEFISNLIDGLLMETSNKLKEEEIKEKKTLKITDKFINEAYVNFFNRFYIKSGYSFLMDIFYGVLQTKKFCKNCNGEIISIKFNPFNMLELPIYQIAKQNKNKILEINQILNEFRAEKKYEIKCDKCKTNKDVYTKTLLYTFPKYLIICFGRAVGNDYIYNNILYDEILDIKSDYDNKVYKFSLECIIEHTGGPSFGHYSALCPQNEEKKTWYRFSDSFCDKNINNFHSKNAVILLYKSFK